MFDTYRIQKKGIEISDLKSIGVSCIVLQTFTFDAAPAPTLPYSKAKFLKRTKVYTHVETSGVDPELF
jgi:hypothetical protein